MKSQPTKNEVYLQVLNSIGNKEVAYPPSEWRERLIRAEYSDPRLLNFTKKEEIRYDK